MQNEWMIGEWMGKRESNDAEGKSLFSRYIKIDGAEVDSKIILKHHLRQEYWARGGRFCLLEGITAWQGIVAKTALDSLEIKFTFDYRHVRANSCNEPDGNPVKLFTDHIIPESHGSSIKLKDRYDVVLIRYTSSESKDFTWAPHPDKDDLLILDHPMSSSFINHQKMALGDSDL